MSEYDAEDRARDSRENRTIGLLAAALAANGHKTQVGAVLRRAEVYAKWLDEGLPLVTVLPAVACHRREKHPEHRHYDAYDRRVLCSGEGQPESVSN